MDSLINRTVRDLSPLVQRRVTAAGGRRTDQAAFWLPFFRDLAVDPELHPVAGIHLDPQTLTLPVCPPRAPHRDVAPELESIAFQWRAGATAVEATGKPPSAAYSSIRRLRDVLGEELVPRRDSAVAVRG